MITNILIVLGIIWLALIIINIVGRYFFNKKVDKAFDAYKRQNEVAVKNDVSVREYFKNFDKNNPLAIIDETPRPVYIGTKEYWIAPLKYRQITRICVLFATILSKLQVQGIDIAKADDHFAEIIATCEDDFFKAIAYVLYFSEKPEDDDTTSIANGVDDTYNFIKKHASLNQLVKILEVIFMQNDVKRALDGFGRFAVKKN